MRLLNFCPRYDCALTRSQEYKGWLYRTAHKRKVDQIQPQEDGKADVVVPSDWQISTFNPEVCLICKRFPWGSHALVLNDGSSCFTTACTTSMGAPGNVPF